MPISLPVYPTSNIDSIMADGDDRRHDEHDSDDEDQDQVGRAYRPAPDEQDLHALRHARNLVQVEETYGAQARENLAARPRGMQNVEAPPEAVGGHAPPNPPPRPVMEVQSDVQVV